MCAHVGFRVAVTDPIFSTHTPERERLRRVRHQHKVQQMVTGEFDAGARATVRVRFENWLGPARYRLIAAVGARWPRR